jgi:hypothetical protein
MSEKVKNQRVRSVRLKPVTPAGTKRIKKLSKQESDLQTLKQYGIPVSIAKRIINRSDKSKCNLSIAQQREQALKDLNITLKSQFETLLDIRDDKTKSCQSDRIHAVKTLNNMIPDFNAPQEININKTSVMLEFTKLSGNELNEIRAQFQGSNNVEDTEFIDIE